ncbi:MAG: cupin domain-containing protein [Actinomycetota bacterium]|nr:cupin domain-containing protein [Actinomycetota bacterium]
MPTPSSEPSGHTTSYELFDAADAPCHRITAGDTVKLAVVRAPGGPDEPSVSYEIWDPGGSQPPNSHPRSTETFWFLAGEGIATSDGAEVPVRAGQLLVLPPGSVHQIRNTGTGRLYAITTMDPDDGFADLIRRGPADELDADDLRILGGITP